jgi:hypothetical protein
MLILLNAFIMISCVHRMADYSSAFRVSGEVLDKETLSPIEGVCVFFIDIGFSENTNKEPIKICKSSNNGQISCKYSHFWGRKEGFFIKKPTKEFSIMLSKNNYIDKIINYKANQIKRINNNYIVDMDKIYMVKKIGDT